TEEDMDASIRAILDRHIIDVQSLIYRNIAGGSLEVMPHWVRGFSGLQQPVFNTFLPRDLAGLSDDTLADTAAFFSSRNTLYGVELIEDFVPGGADYLNDCHYQSLPPELALVISGQPNEVDRNTEIMIEKVDTVPSLTAFCTLMHLVFDFPLRDMIKLYSVAHLKEDRIGLYLAFLDEQPVSAGALLRTNGAASITNLVTIDDYRGQGVATTLTYRMLADARELDCDHVMAYSTAQGFSLFHRLGFEIFSQRQWFLPPGIDYE
ncbi:MAG: GNAT family N-acetyltransferase, partial [Anaerolineae bacterium]|nr:GNAT family N-acetyltransferase [Anaerolineae bacterium]